MKNFIILFLIINCNLIGQNINVYYRMTSVIDTINKEKKFVSEPFILSVIGDKSIYLSVDKLVRDSVIFNTKNGGALDLLLIQQNLAKPSNNKIVYKDHNKITVQNEINARIYTYPRAAPKNIWTLGNKTKIIEGYVCNNAFIHFSGRDWEAWYAKDVAVSNGPLLFGGLPGLIFEIGDTKSLHKIEFLGIDRKVRFYDNIYEDAIVLKSARDFQKIIDNSSGNIISEYESMGVRYSPEAKQMLLENIRNKKKGNNPFELVPEY